VQAYLFDIIFGANDGIITTRAVVSGVTSAALSDRVIVILGLRRPLRRRHFGWAPATTWRAAPIRCRKTGPFPETRCERAPQHSSPSSWRAWCRCRPPCCPASSGGGSRRPWPRGLSALFGIGAGRALFTDRTWLRAGLEILLIGALAAGVAYGVGAAAAAVTGNTMH